jgi:hypothetical protein
MTERQQRPRRPSGRRARSGTTASVVRRGDTVPGGPPILPPADEASLFGLPVEPAADPFVEDEADAVLEPVEDDLVVVLRPDPPAGSLLLVGGTAGALSLFLPWVQHDEALGMTLVQQGVDLAGSGVGALADRGLLLPIGVSTGGAVLLALGLLAFRPAHTHRVTGVVALLVSLAVATGLVVRVADEEWGAVLADPGAFCAVLAAAFGLLGALKAMLTAPEVTTWPS